MKNNSNYPSIHSEGGLLPMDLLERVAVLDDSLPGLKAQDYGLSRTERINEAVNRSWSRLVPIWQAFRKEREKPSSGTTETREDWLAPLLQEFGFGKLTLSKAETIGGKSYAISHRRGDVPVHQISFRLELDRRAERVAGASRVSPHTLLQEYLNRTENSLWGILTNGLQLRILRDSVMLSRQAYLEFDLETMFDGDLFSDFRLLWLVCHESRFENLQNCLLEQWTKFAADSGVRALDKLRQGVTNAIQTLGSGFLKHPANHELKQKLRSGELDKQDYYRQLLRLIYRFLLLFVAEDRGTLWTNTDPETLDRTEESFGTRRLREQSEKLRGTAHGDRWEALKTLFALLDSDQGLPELGIPALGGFLFSAESLPDLKGASLANRDLYEAMRSLSFTMDGNIRRPVNYADLDAEELGGIYESLLEMHPVLDSDTGDFVLNVAAGNERKTTGSYYTPESLIRSLLDSALEPVLAEKLNGLKTNAEQEAALLSLKVCDPACGSGHFLLGAARRLGERLASIRRDGDEPSPDDKRIALRDVIRSCIYGVDLNPMSVELCKVGLWMESMQPGLPLSFLDAHIRCGNSLVGVGPRQKISELRIPDNAFDPKTGDDKTTSTRLKKQNKAESQQMAFTLFTRKEELSSYFAAARHLENMPEDSAAAVRAKKDAFADFEQSEQFIHSKDIGDLWTAAFFWKMEPVVTSLQFPTQGVLWNLQHGKPVNAKLLEECRAITGKVNAFHWPLMFPSVFAGGDNDGFDVLQGNPPWERIKLQEQEFFAERDPEIAAAKNKAERDRMIKALDKTNPALKAAFEDEKHRAECTSKFMRFSSRLPLTAQGDMNLYALFAETNRQLISENGSAGFIVPSGIVSDDGTKEFFGDLVEKRQLYSVYDFENRDKLFPAVDSRMKFSLLTLSGKPVDRTNFVFFAHRTEDLNDPQRRFSLTAEEIARFNPNTHTMPIFRTKVDAELNKKIYSRLPILINEQTGENPWEIQFSRMLDMSNDSHLFSDNPGPGKLRLYEAKYFHHYDHRWATYEGDNNPRDLTLAEKQDPDFTVQTRYYVKESDVAAKVPDFWKHKWFLAFRDVTNNTNERTAILSIIPYSGVGNNAPVIFSGIKSVKLLVAFCGYFSSLSFDVMCRRKVGGMHMNFYIVNQLPILPPQAFSSEVIDFILPRTFELIYSAADLKPFAEDLWNESSEELRQAYQKRGFKPQIMAPFAWNEDRRAMLRAELDAYYARLYGLTRDELRYILDPQDVYGPDFPGETFRVLKDNETAKFGEYRTRRLVLEAWDRLESELGPIDPERLKSYVPSEPASKKTDHGNTEQSRRQSPSAPSHGKQPVSQHPTQNAASKSPASSAWFGAPKPRSTQTSLFPEDTGSPQPSLFTSASAPASNQKPAAPQPKGKPKPAATPSSGTKNSTTVAPQTNTGSKTAAATNNDAWSLFKCSVCGRLIPGFSRPAHEKSHPGKNIEWKKV